MKAQSLSINLREPCNAHCPFCIARLTWKPGDVPPDDHPSVFKIDPMTGLSSRRLDVALGFAKYHHVDTVLITSTGEPTLSMAAIGQIAASVQRIGIPILELQTNGSNLLEKIENPFTTGDLVFGGCLADVLSAVGINTVAISISSMDPIRNAQIMGLPISYNWEEAAKAVVKAGMLCRISLNLLKNEVVAESTHVKGWLDEVVKVLCGLGVHQLTLRDLGKPEHIVPGEKSEQVAKWIDQNALDEKGIDRIDSTIIGYGTRLRPLSYGGSVFDYNGVSVVMTGCMSDTALDEVRSLILQADGHLYHSWNYRGSIIL